MKHFRAYSPPLCRIRRAVLDCRVLRFTGVVSRFAITLDRPWTVHWPVLLYWIPFEVCICFVHEATRRQRCLLDLVLPDTCCLQRRSWPALRASASHLRSDSQRCASRLVRHHLEAVLTYHRARQEGSAGMLHAQGLERGVTAWTHAHTNRGSGRCTPAWVASCSSSVQHRSCSWCS